MADNDYYALLEVEPEADHQLIQVAYWRLATEYGAEMRQRPEAAAKLRELNEAYRVLVTPELRARYDEARRGSLIEVCQKPHDQRQAQERPPEVIAEGLDVKVMRKRILAGLIDLGVLAAALGLVVGIWGDNSASLEGGTFSLGLSLGWQPFLFFCLAALFQFALLEALLAATIGKLALGLRVVRYDGRACGWLAALKRNILRPVDALPFLIPYLVGLGTAGLSHKRQRLGDAFAKTLVVNKIAGR